VKYIKRFVIIMQKDCVLCEVRNKYISERVSKSSRTELITEIHAYVYYFAVVVSFKVTTFQVYARGPAGNTARSDWSRV
jgi:hypothetical protein